MTRRIFGLLAGVAMLVALSSVAEAARVHLKNSVEPIVTYGVDEDGDDVAILDAALAGLGNGDVVIQANMTGTATVVVYNPQGHPSPGQQVPLAAVGSVSIPASDIKNGTLYFTVAAKLPDVGAIVNPTLPNDQWSFEVTDFDFPTAITLTISQGGKVTVIELFSDDFTVID